MTGPAAGLTSTPTRQPAAAASFDVARARADFPALATRVHGKPLAYLDNAATTQKPRQVIDALLRFERDGAANVHRGVHELSQRASAAYDEVRILAQRFVNAQHAAEIVFTHGTTDGLNLVAASYGRSVLRPGDEIVLTELEHHSNIIPWQLVAEATGARIRVARMGADGSLDAAAVEQALSPRTRIVAVPHVSNVLGTITPLTAIAELVHARGAVLVVDGAQAVAHLKVDVQELGCDFYACSGHKMYGPTGVGFLYGRRELLDAMPPYQGGGGMIHQVSFERSTYAPPPGRFEAGTPPIGPVLGLGGALEFLAAQPFAAIHAHEAELMDRMAEGLAMEPRVRVMPAPEDRISVVSFVLEGVHPHDIGTVLDAEGVAVRAGHHCAQPLMQRLGVPATVRASLAMYNTQEEVDALLAGLRRVREVFGS